MSIAGRIPPWIVSMLLALAFWQVAASVGPISDSSIPTAVDSVTTLVQLLGQSETWIALGQTVAIAAIGFALSLLIALPLGILIGLSRFAFTSTKFVFDFFKVIPPIVIIPITILALGPTFQMGVFLVVFGLVFALAIQTAYGVRDADPVLLDTMRAYRQGIVTQIRYARLPSAASFIAVGIRISATAALVIAVVAGLIGGAPGLGRQLLLSQTGGLADQTFAIVLLLGVLGVLVSHGIEWSRRKVIFWEDR